MKVLEVQQGSEEWLSARAGIVTASELDNLISPTLEVREGKTPKTYLHTKLAERWQGFPLQSFGGGVMEQGSVLESEARPWFALEYGVDVETVGLVLTDDGRFGASPDGLVKDRYGVEIKCPQPHTHVKWLLAGEVPPDHLMQCHGGMYATGLLEWRFVSYCRLFPPLVLTVKRDEAVMKLIGEQLTLFYADMDFAWKKLIHANGGAGPAREVEAIDDDYPF